jgi:porphobilinogen deaminase
LLQKALVERLSNHYDRASMDAVHALPDQQAVKLEKVLNRWVDKDLDGRCHAALAVIAQHDGRMAEAGALWQQAYSLGKLPRCAVEWSRWLRTQGDESRAAMIEQEALSSLIASE